VRSNPDSVQKAKEYSFLLLKFRLRSRKELSCRLKRKNFPHPIIEKTLDFLEEKNFLNDRQFARSWIEGRLKKPYGAKRIRQELKLKGIGEDIIKAEMEGLKAGSAEEESLRRLAQDKMNKMNGLEPMKAKRRLYGYLLRRGFSAQAASDAISAL
jgi:regulatory protein